MKRTITILIMILGIALFSSSVYAASFTWKIEAPFTDQVERSEWEMRTLQVNQPFTVPLSETRRMLDVDIYAYSLSSRACFKVELFKDSTRVLDGPCWQYKGQWTSYTASVYPYWPKLIEPPGIDANRIVASWCQPHWIPGWHCGGNGQVTKVKHTYAKIVANGAASIVREDRAKTFGQISQLISNTASITSVTVSSDNLNVMLWVGSDTDYQKKTTTILSDILWACHDATGDGQCDFIQADACINAGWEWTDLYWCVDSTVCSTLGGNWVSDQKKCCDDNDNFPGCINGKVEVDSDKDGVLDPADKKCPKTPSTEIGDIIKDPNNQYYGCGPSERPLCEGKVEGSVCQSGPVCVTIPAYNDQANNAVCASLTCDASKVCSVKTDCKPCPVQNCNQKDSYLVGCYEDSSGLKREYRDYIEGYEVCESGACVASTCKYTVIGLDVLKDFDKDKIPDFCDTDPCGQNTFLGSRALESVGCFCEGNFTNCDQDLSNGCERDANLEGTCPGISKCTTPATTIPLGSGQTCIGPASAKALGGIVCTAGQYFCYGNTPTALCKDPNDYDCDGLDNKYEFEHGLLVFDPIDKDHDPDLEGLVNLMEFKYLTNPFNSDTDEDGLTDLDEINKTNPLEPDTEKDGLIDGDEVLVYKTNPQLQDTDGDALFDGDEIQAVIDWLGIVDKNAIVIFIKEDIDGDGKPNGPFDDDSDGDGLSDFEEVKGINGLISNPFDPENTCSFGCSIWSPDPCEEDQTQTRTCNQGTNCAGVGYTPKASQECRSGFAGLEQKVPFFTNLNILITLVIILSYYLVTLRKKV